MFKKMAVVYWSTRDDSKILGIEHETIYDYSDEKLNELVLHILKNGFNVMVRRSTVVKRSTNPVDLIIWVDRGRFKQM